MNDFPSLDDFESGETEAKPRNDNDLLSRQQPSSFGDAFGDQSSKFPELKSNGETFGEDELATNPGGLIPASTAPYIPGAQSGTQVLSTGADVEADEERDVVRYLP